MSILITTTGTQGTITLDDLGGRVLTHPVVSLDLSLEFTIEEIRDAVQLEAALVAGHITVIDNFGNSVTTLADIDDNQGLSNVLAISGIDDLTEDTVPLVADSIITWDLSALSHKKALLSKLPISDAVNTELSTINSQLSLLTPANQLISGGVSWSGVGLTYDVTALSYRIQGVTYATTATNVTLATADATFDRIDLIIADDTQTVSVVTGIPGASPQAPIIDTTTQIQVTFILVPAGATVPNVNYELIYDENVGTGGGTPEWNTATTVGGVNLADTADPFVGTTHISMSANFGSQKYIKFTPATDYTIVDGTVSFRMKCTVDMTSALDVVSIGFFDVNDILLGNAVTVGGTTSLTYGLDPSNTTTYQLVTIPIAAFGGLTATVNNFRFFRGAGNGTAQFSLDLLRIEEGVIGGVTPGLPALTNGFIWVGDNNDVPQEVELSTVTGMVTGISKNSGATINVAKRSILNFIEGTNITLTITDDSVGDEVDITINSTGGGDVATDVIWDVEGDLAIGTGADTAIRLPIGSAGTFLRSDATTAAWSIVSFPNAASAGDILYASSLNNYDNLSPGTNGHVLTSNGAGVAPSYQASGGGSSRISGAVTTTESPAVQVDVIDTLTTDATHIIEVFITARETVSNSQWGVWKRTLAVNNFGGTVTVQQVSSDMDKQSTGLKPNDVSFAVSGTSVNIDVSGIAATNIDWDSKYEIISIS
jgi:hypothetical protein